MTSDRQTRLPQPVSENEDCSVEETYNPKAKDVKIPSSPDSSSSSVESPRRKLVSWKNGDPENPYNWSSVCQSQTLL
jgi:hypothetical protein